MGYHEEPDIQQAIGTLIDSGNVMRPEISDYIRKHPERLEISELGDPVVGWVAPIDAGEPERLGLPEATISLVEWDCTADEEAQLEIRALNAAGHARVVEQATSTLIDRVMAHYDEHPTDDGHPAYALYKESKRRQTRAAEREAAQRGSATGHEARG